jgi:hypothetical protein
VTRAKLGRWAIHLALAVSLTGAVGCHHARRAGRGSPWDVRPGQVDLDGAFCGGRYICGDIVKGPEEIWGGARMGTADCLTDQSAIIRGSWSIEDAGSRPFEWQARARRGGVLPSLGHVMAILGCGDYHPGYDTPGFLYAFDPDGFADVMLEGDDVFIPLEGQATLDHQSHATATLETLDPEPGTHVRISIEEPDASPLTLASFGRGDRFPWGGRLATVVRVIHPTDGLLGTIGWVEIRLSQRAAPGASL